MQYPSRKTPDRILAIAAAALIAYQPPKDEAERLQWSRCLLELSGGYKPPQLVDGGEDALLYSRDREHASRDI